MDSNPGYYQTLKKVAIDYPTPDYNQILIDGERSYGEVKSEEHKKT